MSGIDLEAVRQGLSQEIEKIDSAAELEELRIKYLGRKGVISQLMAAIPSLSLEERKTFGQKANDLKNQIILLITERQKRLTQKPFSLQPDIDIGMPGIAYDLGRPHPLTEIINEICAIFMRMGFSVVEGPEIETEHNNFTGLNIPLEHPSRDAFDTFYLNTGCDPKLLLRSHTSPVQIRVMSSQKPPLAIVVPGRVYRPDAVDASHSFMFHQIEGFMVDKNIRFSDLKGILEVFAKAVFGEDIKMRFRPHFFPFTEPSAEVDISCIICRREQKTENKEQRKNCPVCHGKGWLEILGSGMIHPNVLKHVGYNPNQYTGFAFGMGVERIAMLKYSIDDIRLFFENDLRFLRQF